MRLTIPEHLKPWGTVVASLFGTSVGAAPIMVISFGVFLKPVSASLGWDRSILAAALFVAIMLNAIGTPFLGRLIDRYGVRYVSLRAITFFSLTTAAIGLIVDSKLVLFALFAAWGLMSCGQSQVPYVTAISSVMSRNRGLALGIGMCGLGIGAVIIPPATVFLIDYLGWRGAYAGLGLLTFLVAFPAVFFLVHVPKRASEVDATAPRETPYISVRTSNSMWKSRPFWFINISVFLMSIAVNGAVTQIVPILTDQGLTPGRAAQIASIAGVATVVGKISSGFFVDRFRPPLVAAIYFCFPLFGFAGLLMGWFMNFPILGMLSLGTTLGAEVALAGTLVTRYFGLARFGEIFGTTAFAFSVGVALSSLVMNLSFDIFGTYNIALLLLAIGLVVAIVLTASLPNVRSDTDKQSR